MKNFIKRILVAILFTIEERNVIMHSLEYSKMRYEKRGSTHSAVKVGMVIEKMFGWFGKPCDKCGGKNVKCMSQNEVEINIGKLIQRTAAITGAYTLQKFIEHVNYKDTPAQHVEEVHLHEVNPEKCAECEQKEHCLIYKLNSNRKPLKKDEEETTHKEDENDAPQSPSNAEPQPPTFEEACGEKKVEE